ncbi:uncharacterized protein LOC142332803 [Lycorma delicatula]|uniref:uncharacterized protein LOC142332800 n=1 Tax=Lycorma delicatula TaxID=130591 RepID=UPI003F514DB2
MVVVKLFRLSLLTSNITDYTEKFSSLSKLIRVITYCFRFIQNIKHKSTNDRKFDALSSNELEFTLEFFIHQSQLAYFKSEINDLQNQCFISKQSKLSLLDPFLDYKGLLRVGGRLEHSNLSFDKKHQLILHPHANITRLIIHSEHLRLLHAGLQLTHSSLWIVNAKK